MIKPTVGRVVWFYPKGKAQLDAGEQPHAALVAHVWSDRCVNLAIFDQDGTPYGRTSVTLLQDSDAPSEYAFATWMPYQVGQAARVTPAVAPNA